MSKTVLSVRDLRVHFSLRGKTLAAVRGAGLDLYENETLAIVGESGSGKSVTAYSIMRILESNGRIEEGSVLYKGKDVTKFTEKLL